MSVLDTIRRKNKKLVAGLMSGTSADGIDTVLVELRGHGLKSKVRQLAFRTYPYPKGLRSFLMRNSDTKTARLDDIVRLDTLIAMLFAGAVKAPARPAGIPLTHIDLSASDGPTIPHLPIPHPTLGHEARPPQQAGKP